MHRQLKTVVNKFLTMGVVALLGVAALVAGGCGAATPGGKMKVTATIFPLADFCRNVGGDLVEVRVLIPAGASPHTYEPTPEVMRFVGDSRVFVENGLGLESWAADTVAKVGKKDMVVVVAAAAVPGDRLIHATGGDEEGPYDPHVWLDPTLAVYQVRAIRDGFTEADPSHRDEYERNAERYMKELESLDGELESVTAGFKEKDFVSTHPSLTYFARRYGLKQVGSIEELPGKEPSIADINNLITKVRKLGVRAIFAEPQLNPKAVQVIAQDAGDEINVEVVDPVGNPDDPEVSTYIELMRHDAEVMGRAL